MYQDPGPLKRLLKLIQDFFLRLLDWIFAKYNHEPDSEARTDLPTSIVYGETLPPWVSESSKKHKYRSESQPLRHSNEWALTKALFLPSPPLPKKPNPSSRAPPFMQIGPNDFRIRSQALVGYTRTTSAGYSQDPPMIRIEDWSSPTTGAHRTVCEPPAEIAPPPSRPNPTHTSNRDSLTVPRMDFVRFPKDSKTRETKGTASTGAYKRSHSGSTLDQYRRRRTDTGYNNQPRPSSLPHSASVTRYPKQNCPPVRPKQTPGLLLSSSELDLLASITVSSEVDGEIKQIDCIQDASGFNKPVLRPTSPDAYNRPNVQRTSHRRQQRTISKIEFMTRRHHSNPLSARASTPPWDSSMGTTKPYATETSTSLFDGGTNRHRHPTDPVRQPFSTKSTLPSDVQVPPVLHKIRRKSLEPISETDFYDGLATPPLEKETTSSSSSGYFADVPYPEVFNLDEYFEDFYPSAPPTPSVSESFYSSTMIHEYPPLHNGSENVVIGISTCTSETSSLGNTLTPDSASPSDSFINNTSATGEHGDKYIMIPKKVIPIWKPVEWTHDTDDDDQTPLSRSDYSNESYTQTEDSSSSVDTPLAQILSSRRLEGRENSSSHKRVGIIMGGGHLPSIFTIGTKCKTSLSDRNNETNSSLSPKSKENVDLEQIRAYLRSRYALARLQCDSHNHLDSLEGDTEDSLLSFMESYSSGLVLSQLRKYRSKNLSSSTTFPSEQRLDPVIEASFEGTGSVSDPPNPTPPKALPSDELSGHEISAIAVDRRPLASRTNMVSVGPRMNASTDRQPADQTKPLEIDKHYRRAALVTVGLRRLESQRRVSGASRNSRAVANTGMRDSIMNSTKNPTPETPHLTVGGRVMPQKF